MVDPAMEALAVAQLRRFTALLRAHGLVSPEGEAQHDPSQQLSIALTIRVAVATGAAANPDARWVATLERAVTMIVDTANHPDWRPMTATEYVELADWLDRVLDTQAAVIEAGAA